MPHCGHYHQPAGCQPTPIVISPGTERVELVTAGRGWVRHAEAWVEVAAGSLLWHMPSDQTIGRSDDEDPYRCLSVQFIVDHPPTDTMPRRVARLSRWADVEAVRAFTRQAVARHVDDQFPVHVLRDQVFGQLQYLATVDHHHAPDPALPAAVMRVCKTIESQYVRPWTIPQLAEIAGLSPAHMHDLFRLHLSQTPHQALIRRRIRAARERLVSTDQPIKQVARACGFSSDAALCRRFRLITGYTPAAYRRRFTDPMRSEMA